MSDPSTILVVQAYPLVGDLAHNTEQVRWAYREACLRGHGLAVFPELMVAGYPPEDLVLLPAFRQAVMEANRALIALTKGQTAAMLLGTVWVENERIYNAALFIEDGEVRHLIAKHHLPNMGVFDEKRLFDPGELHGCFDWRGHRLGVLICEDMWHDDAFGRLGAQGCDLAIVINGSPFEEDKQQQREAIVSRAAANNRMSVLYCNMACGQDELIFDGQSFFTGPEGEVIYRCAAFREDLEEVTLSGNRLIHGDPENPVPAAPIPDRLSSIYQALMLGLYDYVTRNGAEKLLLGLSGGIDSALVACVAVDALGAENVRAVMMPYRYTAEISLQDAARLAERLGIAYDVVPIEPGMAGALAMLAPLAGENIPAPLATENLQSRLRGLLLMAISNSTGALVLSTGNKSELAMGYATLYGDMNGAYNPLKDIYKTDVFALCRWRNAHRPRLFHGPDGEVIPERIITRPPSAELRPDQRDADALPPYDRLDAMLRRLIEGRGAVDDLVRDGFDRPEAERVARLLYQNEYKRFQSPPGPKISRMNFGRDRRYPMTNGFRLGRCLSAGEWGTFWESAGDARTEPAKHRTH